MPRGDKKAPQGKGPVSGRRRGNYAGSEDPGYKQNRRFATSRRQNRQSRHLGQRGNR
jgi:hypothetical protein